MSPVIAINKYTTRDETTTLRDKPAPVVAHTGSHLSDGRTEHSGGTDAGLHVMQVHFWYKRDQEREAHGETGDGGGDDLHRGCGYHSDGVNSEQEDATDHQVVC